MSSTETWLVRMVRIDCYNCHVVFGMTQAMYDEALEDGDRWFYCPNGHRQHFTESEVNKLKKQVQKYQRSASFWHEETQRAREQRDAVKRQRAAIKGQVTKLKKRAAAGVCPCCKRTFQNLKRHMSHMHPDFAQ